VLLVVLMTVRVSSAAAVYPVNPALLLERAKLPIHREQPGIDKLLLLAIIITGFVALPLIIGFDVFSWHVLPRPAPLASSAGLMSFILGWVIQGLALHANAFAASVVRLQYERGHAVVDSGVYRIIRHPFYAGTPLVLIGMSLWLESYLALVLALVPTAFVLIRLQQEEQFLRRELPGYSEYATRVRFRLVPGIW
jgi:protein-S-isoprenylcysteine O-methyltransferase Ste14